MIRVKFKSEEDRSLFLNYVVNNSLMTREEYEDSTNRYVFDAIPTTVNINFVERTYYILYWKGEGIMTVDDTRASPCSIEQKVRKELLSLLSKD